jgi:hypothetical protein
MMPMSPLFSVTDAEILRQGRFFENTVEVGGTELKWGANVGQEIFKICVYIIDVYQLLTMII